MFRYLRVAFLIGVTVALGVVALYHYNLLRPLDVFVQKFLGLPDYMSALRWPYMYALIPTLALSIAWTTVDITRPSLKAVVAIGAFLQVAATVFVMALYNHFFAPSAPLLAVMLTFIFGMMYSRTVGGQRKRLVRQLFGERVTSSAFRKMVDSGLPANFNGERLEGTVLVCEVFNHDELMEKLSPEDYVAMVNLHLGTASQFLVDQGAYLDECDGEGIRALFGTPLPVENHAAHAVKTAMSLDLRLKNLNMECDTRWHQMLDYRLGISSGSLVAGAFGSGRLGGFGAAGESVDFARRLCAANTVFGTRILIGPDTCAGVMESFEIRPIEMVRHGEEGERVEIYEPLAPAGEMQDADRERQELFWEGIVYYRESKWNLALERFRKLAESATGDPASQFYIQRIERLQTGRPALDVASQRPFGSL